MVSAAEGGICKRIVHDQAHIACADRWAGCCAYQGVISTSALAGADVDDVRGINIPTDRVDRSTPVAQYRTARVKVDPMKLMLKLVSQAAFVVFCTGVIGAPLWYR